MNENLQERELKERIELIETMLAEGRHSTESWGWVFVLWGVAYYVAIAWSASGWNSNLAWPVTMVASGLVTGALAGRNAQGRPLTGMVRAISSIWRVTGISLFVVMLSLGYSGRLDVHTSLAMAGAMLAVANGASSMILRWRMQLVCALVWLGAAEVGCFGTGRQGLIAFLVANFFCQIVFGIYLMITESRRQHVHGESHA